MSTIMVLHHLDDALAIDPGAKGLSSCLWFVVGVANIFSSCLRLRFSWGNEPNRQFPCLPCLLRPYHGGKINSFRYWRWGWRSCWNGYPRHGNRNWTWGGGGEREGRG